MFTIIDIANKSVELLAKWANKKIERNHKILKLLNTFDIIALRDDVDSIYAHALVEYAVDADPSELTKLYAVKEIRKAFQQNLYKDDQPKFKKILEQHLHSDNKLSKLASKYKSAKNLYPEINRFKELYENFILQAGTPFQKQKYNELNQFMTKILEDKERKSFDFQVESYLHRLIEEFQKRFPDKDSYIDLNAEVRVEKKAGKGDRGYRIGEITNHKQKLKKIEQEKPGVLYESIVYRPVDTFINQWLNDDSQNLLVILGEYGTGKTTFLKHMAHQMACSRLDTGKKYTIKDKKKRLPLFFPLRDFEKNIESLIVTYFSREGIDDINFASFKQRIANDELIIMLDGFDEMTRDIEVDEKGKNFDKIRQLIECSEKSKIILTVRHEYFQSKTELLEVFKHGDKKNYRFIHFLPFDDEQIQQYLHAHMDNPDYYWEHINKIFDLPDLAKRPVHLGLIVDYLPALIREKGEKATFNVSELYHKCIEDELRRKSNSIIPKRYRLEILQKVAVWMFLNDTLSSDIGMLERELNLKQYFKTDRAWEFEKYLNDFLTFTFLIPDTDNHFHISHKSFQDYLTASAFVKEIKNDEIEHFGKKRTTEEINQFIIEQEPDVPALLNLVQNTCDLPRGRQWQGTNAAAVLLRIDKKILKGRDLTGCQLSYVDFQQCDLTGTNFSNTNLSNCSFSDTVLSACLQAAEMYNSSLYLYFSDIKDIRSFKECKGLNRLYLFENNLTDISPIKELKDLTVLDFGNNQITDISPVRELKNLKYLYLSKDQLDENQKAGLKQVIPGLEIEYY